MLSGHGKMTLTHMVNVLHIIHLDNNIVIVSLAQGMLEHSRCENNYVNHVLYNKIRPF